MPLGSFRLNGLSRLLAAATGRTAKTVTASGNAQISTAQSQFGGSSALFDGTSDYLTVTGTGFNWGTGDFTVEAWVRHVAINDQQVYWDFRTGSTNHHIFYITSGNKLEYYDGSTYTGTTSLAANTWYHLAVSRSSGRLRIFINGTQEISTSNSGNHSSSGPMVISSDQTFFSTNSVNGYMDEVRVSNIARYTTNFNPSSSAFVNDANTLLLLHMNGTNASTTFTDDTSLRVLKQITASGNAQISTAQSKLGSSSALFDGTGDYLTVTTNDFDLSKYKGPSGQYTIEAFVRIGNLANTSVAQGAFLAPTMLGNMVPGSGYQFWSFGPVSDGRVAFYYYTGSSNGLYTTGVTLTTNVWYHVAFVYNAGVGKIYVDGVERASATLATDAMYEISTAFTIGSAGNTSFNGHMDEIRVSKTARYTSGFTPTTTQFVDDNDTVLLLHCEGANTSTTFTDDATSGNYSFAATAQRPKSITARGNAKVSTAQSKFGGASALFDGTGDYLFIDSTQDLNHGTGNFTIEFQVRFSATTGCTLIDYRSQGFNGAYPAIYWTASTIRYYANNADRITSGTLSLNTWYHVALSRSGTSTRMFINGSQVGVTYTDSTNYVIGGRMTAGADSNSLGNFSLNGYMDEIRVSNTARYTAAFTAPNAAFTTDANTLLLVHCDGANNSTTFTDDTTLRTAKTVTPSGNAQVSTAQSRFDGASILFDGTDDRLTVSGNNDVLFWNTQPFTVEYWCRISAFATEAGDDPVIIGNMDPNSSANYWAFGPDNSGNLTFKYWNGANNTVKATGTMNLNQWYHCAAVISGNTIRIYLDGVQQNSAAISGTPQFGTGYGGLNIGWGRSSQAYIGYLDEIRISNLARYPSGTTFTPSTTPFVNDGNTILLIHGNGVNASTTFTDDNA